MFNLFRTILEGNAMIHPPVLMKSIYQKDNYTFTVHWSDDIVIDYRLDKLQQRCPCARCYDTTTGQRRVVESLVDPKVRAIKITNVGRYAIRIQFTSGCSTGIYNYSLLREF